MSTTPLIDDAGPDDTTAEQPAAKVPWWSLRRWVPWSGPATRTDKALMVALSAMLALGLVVRPLRPFLIANHPVLLEFLTGGKATIGAAAAFARVGEFPLWLVIVAGTVGMIKFDWLTWWAGRQWGRGIIGFFTTGEQADRWADRAQRMRPWVLKVLVVAAGLPGIPGAIVFALAGWTRMRLATFMILNTIGALVMTGVLAGIGYALGQSAVDVVLMIDKYALAVSLSVIVGIALLPVIKKGIRALRR